MSFVHVYRYHEVLFNHYVDTLFEASDLKKVSIVFFIFTIRAQC